jgi:hypothetical protein
VDDDGCPIVQRVGAAGTASRSMTRKFGSAVFVANMVMILSARRWVRSMGMESVGHPRARGQRLPVNWQFNMGLRTVQSILVTPCEIPGLAVSIETARLCSGFLGRN